MENNKEFAIYNFNKMVQQSWTYGKMTEEEKERWAETLESAPVKNAVKGTYNQRWEILQGIYHSFLLALGYTWNWRDEDENATF